MWYVYSALHETWLTAEEVARFMHVKPKTVRSWIKRGVIKRATMVNRRAGWLIPQSEVDRLLLENERERPFIEPTA